MINSSHLQSGFHSEKLFDQRPLNESPRVVLKVVTPRPPGQQAISAPVIGWVKTTIVTGAAIAGIVAPICPRIRAAIGSPIDDILGISLVEG